MRLLLRRDDTDLTDDLSVQIERWFIRRGVPHFIDQYNAREDILTRASGALSIWFLIAMTGFSPFNSAVENGINLAAGVTILLALLIISNRRAGRPVISAPTRIGTPSLTVFVLLPAIVPLAANFDFVAAATTVLVQLVALLVIYLAASYAIGPLIYWALRNLFEQLGAMLGLFSRALPLLMLITIVMFISAETWQAAAGASTRGYVATMALFVVAGLTFLVSRLPREIDSLAAPLEWPEAAELTRTTPVAGLVMTLDEPPTPAPPMERTQRWNVGLVMLVRQSVQVLIVAILVALFFLAFGKLFIAPEVIESWVGTSPRMAVQLDIAGIESTLSRELMLVAGFVSAFSGLYFAVYVSTDATYRQEFHDDIADEIRRALVVREVYLALVSHSLDTDEPG